MPPGPLELPEPPELPESVEPVPEAGGGVCCPPDPPVADVPVPVEPVLVPWLPVELLPPVDAVDPFDPVVLVS